MSGTNAAVEAMSNVYRDGVGVTPNAAWMRRLLEAAAPHLMAEAWDEGRTWNDYDKGNPYRGQP